MKIDELKPFKKKIDLIGKITDIRDVREVVSKFDDTTHKVTEATITDETGSILLTLWDDLIDFVERDQVYKINNGYTSLFKNSIRLNVGRFGKIEKTDDQLAELKTENNLSEKDAFSK